MAALAQQIDRHRGKRRRVEASAHQHVDALADLAQHAVTCGMSEAVVDPLEVVDVDQAEGEGLALLLGQRQLALQALVEVAMVTEFRERVGEREAHRAVWEIWDLDRPLEADAAVSALTAQGRRAAALRLDVGQIGSFDAFAEDLRRVLDEQWGRSDLDFLVNNAGIGSYAPFASLAVHPPQPYSDLTVLSGRCYQYQYVVSDRVGNTTTYTSSAVAKGPVTNAACPASTCARLRFSAAAIIVAERSIAVMCPEPRRSHTSVTATPCPQPTSSRRSVERTSRVLTAQTNRADALLAMFET